MENLFPLVWNGLEVKTQCSDEGKWLAQEMPLSDVHISLSVASVSAKCEFQEPQF
jgi:hypothetical protein